MDFWDWFFILLFFVPAALLWAAALFDIFRRTDFSDIRKAIWVAVVIFFPFIGTIVYLIMRKPTDVTMA